MFDFNLTRSSRECKIVYLFVLKKIIHKKCPCLVFELTFLWWFRFAESVSLLTASVITFHRLLLSARIRHVFTREVTFSTDLFTITIRTPPFFAQSSTRPTSRRKTKPSTPSAKSSLVPTRSVHVFPRSQFGRKNIDCTRLPFCSRLVEFTITFPD